MAKKTTAAPDAAKAPKKKRRAITPYAKAVSAVKKATTALNRANATAATKRKALAAAETHLATFKK